MLAQEKNEPPGEDRPNPEVGRTESAFFLLPLPRASHAEGGARVTAGSESGIQPRETGFSTMLMGGPSPGSRFSDMTVGQEISLP